MTIKPDKNYCKNQGLLIGSGVAIWQNPTVYRSLDTCKRIPCSNIFCANCNNKVRWIDGAILKGDPKDFYPLQEPEISQQFLSVDGYEVNTHHTNPNDEDSDGDGLSDSWELFVYGTDPTDSDTDGVSDGVEVSNGDDPNDPN